MVIMTWHLLGVKVNGCSKMNRRNNTKGVPINNKYS